jgi:class 3 adenylate cyclase
VFESVDVRQALPLITAPTLIMHNRNHPLFPIDHGRYLAAHIDGATFVEFDGPDVFVFPSSWAEVTAEVANFVTGEQPPEIDRILATVLFTDIVGSTELASSMGDGRWRSTLDGHDRAVREQIRRFRGKEINTTGDGFVVSFDGPARAIKCAREIVSSTPVAVRVGLHTGECEVRGQDLGGLAVHIAARIGALASPGEVLVSSTVKDLVAGSGISFADRGSHALKGIPDEWRLYAPVDA